MDRRKQLPKPDRKSMYGLIIPSRDLKPQAPEPSRPPAKRKNIFDEDDSDSEEESSTDWVKESLKKQGHSSMQQKQSTQVLKKAIADDPSVFQYDELYDDMERKREDSKLEAKKDRKPKYIEKLLKTAESRQREYEEREERKVQKEREAEGDMYKDKEEFVTGAYRKKMEELERIKEEQKRKDAIDDMTDVTKQKDLSGFYRHLYRQQVQEPETNNVAENNDDSNKSKESQPKGLSREDSNKPKESQPKGLSREDSNEHKESQPKGLSREDSNKPKESQPKGLSRERRRSRSRSGTRRSRSPRRQSSSRSRRVDYHSRRTTRSRSKNRVSRRTGRSRSRDRDYYKSRRSRSRSRHSLSRSSRHDDKKKSSPSRKHEDKKKDRDRDDRKERDRDERKKSDRSENSDKRNDKKPTTVPDKENLKEDQISPAPKKISIWAKRTVGQALDDALARYFARKQANTLQASVVSAD